MFATVIAITKDLPDVEGDMANNITTFATRLGVKNVSLLGEWYGPWSCRRCSLWFGCWIRCAAAVLPAYADQLTMIAAGGL